MQLTLADHPITDLQFGSPTRLDETVLTVDPAVLRSLAFSRTTPSSASISTSFAPAKRAVPDRSSMSSNRVRKRPATVLIFRHFGSGDHRGYRNDTCSLRAPQYRVLAEISPDLTRSATGRVLR